MTEKHMLHIICICGTLICACAWFAGYFSGTHGWWWTGFGVAVVYAIIYKTLSGHGH